MLLEEIGEISRVFVPEAVRNLIDAPVGMLKQCSRFADDAVGYMLGRGFAG